MKVQVPAGAPLRRRRPRGRPARARGARCPAATPSSPACATPPRARHAPANNGSTSSKFWCTNSRDFRRHQSILQRNSCNFPARVKVWQQSHCKGLVGGRGDGLPPGRRRMFMYAVERRHHRTVKDSSAAVGMACRHGSPSSCMCVWPPAAPPRLPAAQAHGQFVSTAPAQQ